MPVDSPCISVCRMNAESRLCEGCLRTLDEIASWGGMSDQEKRLVCDQIERRKGSKAMPGSDRDDSSIDTSGTF